MIMLYILPQETVQEYLSELDCQACGRKLENHTDAEIETCRRHTLSPKSSSDGFIINFRVPAAITDKTYAGGG